MINEDKWISSIAKLNTKNNEEANQLDHNRWVNTIPKKNKYNSVKKYSLMGVLFVFGLLFVSAVKNETRNLQKIINNLQTSVNVLRYNLDQALLDHEVITSPENISRLAKEFLDTDLASYKRSQIQRLDTEKESFTGAGEVKKEKVKNLAKSIKSHVAKKIEKKRTEIRKFQELYSNPKSIPKEVRAEATKQIKQKKNELKNMYESPKEFFTKERLQRWSLAQVVKLFLGIPVIPGK